MPAAAAPAPSFPLGPWVDSALAWTTWATLMGSLGLLVLAAVTVGPVGRRLGTPVTVVVTRRLAVPAAVLALLAVPAVLADLGHGLGADGGVAWGEAWSSLFDGSNEGRLLGIEVVGTLVEGLLALALVFRPLAGGRARGWLLGTAVAAGAVALGTTKFPTEVPEDWGRDSFETVMWMLHLLGGAVWAGGLLGLLLLALPGALPAALGAEDRRAFWGATIRRFSVAAMSCVAAIALSGLWLYWEHVDGPSQLFSTMYGRVLGVKILIFGSLLVLGAVNQFWLHPRIEAMRAAGDERPLRTIVAREFRTAVAVETLLILAVLFVAPFLHGSARNQAFQTEAAANATSASAPLPKIAPKQVTTSTWVWGTAETVVVVAVMLGGYQVSGRVAKRLTARRAGSAADGVALHPAGVGSAAQDS